MAAAASTVANIASLESGITAATDAALSTLINVGIDSWIADVASEAVAEGVITTELVAASCLFQVAGMSVADAEATTGYLVSRLIRTEARMLSQHVADTITSQLVDAGLAAANVSVVSGADHPFTEGPARLDPKILALRDRCVADARKCIAARMRPHMKDFVRKLVDKAAQDAAKVTKVWAKTRALEITSLSRGAFPVPWHWVGVCAKFAAFQLDSKRKFGDYLKALLWTATGRPATRAQAKEIWSRARREYFRSGEWQALRVKVKAEARELCGAPALDAPCSGGSGSPSELGPEPEAMGSHTGASHPPVKRLISEGSTSESRDSSRPRCEAVPDRGVDQVSSTAASSPEGAPGAADCDSE